MDENESHPLKADDDVQQWQIEHIKASIKQADAGKLISHEDVKNMAAKWRRQ